MQGPTGGNAGQHPGGVLMLTKGLGRGGTERLLAGAVRHMDPSRFRPEIAYLLTDSFERMLVIATAVAVGSSVVGTLASFHLDGATGACIVLIQFIVFILAFLFAPKRGLVTNWRRIESALP